MPTPHKFWQADKTMDAFDHSRFGLMSRVLTESRGQELLTLYLEAFRARTLARPVPALELKASEVGCGRTCRELLARYSQISSTWKTAQHSLLGASEEFLGTWPRWGSMRNGESLARITPTLPTFANASGLLPTPTASNTKAHHMRGSDKGKAREPRSYGTHGPLNPRFLEWHMGWPVGWTKLEPLEMGKFHEWQQQHGKS